MIIKNRGRLLARCTHAMNMLGRESQALHHIPIDFAAGADLPFQRSQPGRAIPMGTSSKGDLWCSSQWNYPMFVYHANKLLIVHVEYPVTPKDLWRKRSRVKHSKPHKGKLGTCSRLSLQQALFKRLLMSSAHRTRWSVSSGGCAARRKLRVDLPVPT